MTANLPEGRHLRHIAEPEGLNIMQDKRATDTMRDRYIRHLSECLQDGQLTHSEFEARSQVAMEATTVRQLEELVYDLREVKGAPDRRAQAERWLDDRWHRVLTHVAIIVAGISLAAGPAAVLSALHAPGYVDLLVDIPAVPAGVLAVVTSLVWLCFWLNKHPYGKS